MDKEFKILLAILFTLLLLCSICSFIYGIVVVVQYNQAKSLGMPDLLLDSIKPVMISTLTIGVVGTILFSTILYFLFSDTNNSPMFFVVFAKILCTLLLLGSIGSIAYGGYMLAKSRSDATNMHNVDKNLMAPYEKKIGTICLGVGIPGFIFFGLLFIKLVARDMKQLLF